MKSRLIVKIALAFILITGLLLPPGISEAATKTDAATGKIEILHVMEKASSKSRKLGSLKQGTQLTVYTATKSGWAEIRYKSKKEYTLTKQVKFASVSSSARYLQKIAILPKSKYDKKEANAMLSRLDNIPAKLLKQLYENGYNIKLVNGPITNEPEMEEFKGVTPRGWEGTGLTWDDVPGAGGNPVIVRIGYSERGKGHGAINLELHETAHAIDYMLDISHSSKFIKVWKAEQKKVLKASYYQYPEEYFAETFAMYYLSSASRKQLSAKAPLTVKFIKGL